MPEAAAANSARAMRPILILITSPHRDGLPTHFSAYSRPEFTTEEGLMNGTLVNYRVEGAKYGIRFGTARDLLHQQPLGAVGDHPRPLQLALCDLLRAVQVARGGMSFTGGKTEIASTVTSKKSR